MTSEPLKPCPLCNGYAHLTTRLSDGLYAIRCQTNGCGLELEGFDMKEFIIKAWNTRTTPLLEPLEEEQLTIFIEAKVKLERIKNCNLLAKAICSTFGHPRVRFPEKKSSHIDYSITNEDDAFNAGYNEAISACSKSLREAGITVEE